MNGPQTTWAELQAEHDVPVFSVHGPWRANRRRRWRTAAVSRAAAQQPRPPTAPPPPSLHHPTARSRAVGSRTGLRRRVVVPDIDGDSRPVDMGCSVLAEVAPQGSCFRFFLRIGRRVRPRRADRDDSLEFQHACRNIPGREQQKARKHRIGTASAESRTDPLTPKGARSHATPATATARNQKGEPVRRSMTPAPTAPRYGSPAATARPQRPRQSHCTRAAPVVEHGRRPG